MVFFAKLFFIILLQSDFMHSSENTDKDLRMQSSKNNQTLFSPSLTSLFDDKSYKCSNQKNHQSSTLTLSFRSTNHHVSKIFHFEHICHHRISVLQNTEHHRKVRFATVEKLSTRSQYIIRRTNRQIHQNRRKIQIEKNGSNIEGALFFIL